MQRTLIAASLAVLAVTSAGSLAAQTDTRPTIAVLPFSVSIMGPGAADYASLSKGVADLLASELIRNPGLRVVERDRLEVLLREQNLSGEGRMDPTTVVQMGKLLGAKHMIYGDIFADMDPRTREVRTVTIAIRTVDSETSQLLNLGDRMRGNADEMMGLIMQAAERASRDLKLPAIPAGPAREAANTAQAVQKKAPMKTVMLYSRALEAQDKGNRDEAVTLFRQAIDTFPEHEPSKTALKKLGAS
jgi:TolB-like protein